MVGTLQQLVDCRPFLGKLILEALLGRLPFPSELGFKLLDTDLCELEF